MKRFAFLLISLFNSLCSLSQLKDIKIIIPKELGYTYYDFVQFLPDEKYFVVCANSLSVFNTETAEVVDEYDLPYGAKNLSISNDGSYILCTINSELYVFTFRNQKLELYFKTTTAELIKGQPNSEYYGALHLGGCFFTNKPGEIYASVGSFSLLYDLQKKTAVSSYTFPLTDYIIHAVYSPKTNEALLAKSTGTVGSIIRQSLDDIKKTSEVISDPGTIVKTRVRDSLLFCFTNNKYFILNITTQKVVHEVRMPIFDYSFYDKKTYAEINKRPSITRPDTLNFEKDEYVYDIDYLRNSGLAVYSTSKGLKFIDLKTKKLSKKTPGSFTNVKLSSSGKRMVCNGYSPYKALRVYEPSQMKLVSERPAMGNAITSADISPNKRWLYTNGSSSGFFWDLRNFSKYAEIKDISGSDSAFIYGVFFLNDTEVVVNSGKSFQHLNLHIYNLHKKKYSRAIKKNVYATTAGFLNGEFYYADYSSLHIINLKTMAEEKYDGLYSMAAGGMYQVVNFTKDLVFIPESGKYRILNRKTKKTEYESGVWSVNARVLIGADNKSVYTASQITKKKTISGVEVDMPVNAIVKIDITKKEIVRDFAQTYYPYDMKFRENGKVLGIWYVKYDVSNYNAKEQETIYSEYDTETGQELLSRTLAKTPEIVAYHYTSETGKYFALNNPMGKFLKVYDDKGNEVMDLSDLPISIPKCFFIEDLDKLIITSTVNSLATFVDLKQKKIVGQLANANSDNFFLITSDLYYLGSKDFIKNMRFKYQSEIYSFEQFDAYLNLPHRVLRDFGCSDSALIQAYETAYLKRMRILGLKPGSKINFTSLPTIQDVKMQEGKTGFADFSLSANKGGEKLTKLLVYNNGTLIFTDDISSEQAAHYEKSMSFETSSGINRFEFVVKDEKGLESPHTTRLFNNTNSVKPNLYLVVIGSEKFKDKRFDLTYAVKDAGDIANAMINSKAFGKVNLKKVFNQSFTTDSVKKLSAFFADATINDVVMVFFAGHGYLDTDLSYYFPTYYTDFSDPKINSVPYKQFEGLFASVKPTRKLMFIDACFSGEVDEEDVEFTPVEEKKETKKDSSRSISVVAFSESTAMEMSKAVFSDLRQNSGATIISSAGGTEAAFEGAKWNNGLFTHCLLDGMTHLKADENRDKKITLSELQKFIAEEVNRLSEGKQTPTYRMENTILDYELW
jgi:uncharacterized caspase-like protein